MADKPIKPLVGDGIDTNDIRRGWTNVYTNYSIMHFPNWKALEDFAKKIETEAAKKGNDKFKNYINNQLLQINTGTIGSINFNAYGLNGKQPKSYDEAMQREEFLYLREYLNVKEKLEKQVIEWLRFDSTAETMKPKLVYNDKAIGEFVFAKAAMALKPKLFYYSPSKNKEIDINKYNIEYKGKKMFLSDGSEVVFAYKVRVVKADEEKLKILGEVTKRTKKIDGEIYNLFKPFSSNTDVSKILSTGYKCEKIENDFWVGKEKSDEDFVYIENKGEESLKQARKKGLLEVKSDNKKVYLYKEKRPKVYNTIKILVGLTAGGFTNWINDFYTGVTAVIVAEILESLGYSVGIDVAVGGGRCSGCTPKLRFNNTIQHGRRFFVFTAKEFGEQMDRDTLLKTVADPSFHNIKWISYMNNFFAFFGDQVAEEENPSGSWHGVESYDMENPIGTYERALDYSKGNRNLLHFYVHRVSDKQGNLAIEDCLEYIKSIVLTVLNVNKKAAERLEAKSYDI